MVWYLISVHREYFMEWGTRVVLCHHIGKEHWGRTVTTHCRENMKMESVLFLWPKLS